MLLSFNIANHFRSNPLVYLNNLRINGDKHDSLSYSKNGQLVFTIDVEDDVVKTLPNHYLSLLLRKSENGDFASISLLKSKEYLDFGRFLHNILIFQQKKVLIMFLLKIF